MDRTDGDSSKTVEQIGIEQDYIKGVAVYYAWYEMYPKSVVKLDLVIQAGDTISAEVKYLGNNTYQLSLEDVTSGHSSTIQVQSSKPIRSSAEWIEEGTGRVADFNTVTFTNAHERRSCQQVPLRVRLAIPPGRRKRLLW